MMSGYHYGREAMTTGTYKPIITTYTGKQFNLLEPTFDIDDIAHALSNTCRYAGHCSEFYSVAEHSVLVSHLMEELQLGDPFLGLMHDGHEAYLSDVPSPFKQLLPDWQKIDADLEAALHKHFALQDNYIGCKQADVIAFFIERDHLFLPADQDIEIMNSGKYPQWKAQAQDMMKDGWEIICYYPEDAKILFMESFNGLQEQAGEG